MDPSVLRRPSVGAGGSPSHNRHRGMQNRFRDRSLSTSMSSYSGASDRVSPGPKKRSLLKRLGSRAEHSSSSLEDRTLAGKSASVPAIVPSRSGFLTPPEERTRLDSHFGSPETEALSRAGRFDSLPRSVSSKGSEEWVRSVPSGGMGTLKRSSTVPSDGGEGGLGGMRASAGIGSGRPGKGSLKRMFSSVPSPSHLRRSMSFASSMSAISSAATRVASGAMTPIRRRRHRRYRSNGDDLEDSLGDDGWGTADWGGGGGGGANGLEIDGMDKGGGSFTGPNSQSFEVSPHETGALSSEGSPKHARKGMVRQPPSGVMADAASLIKEQQQQQSHAGVAAGPRLRSRSASPNMASASSTEDDGSRTSSLSGVPGGVSSANRRKLSANWRRRHQVASAATSRRSPPLPEQRSTEDGIEEAGPVPWAWGVALPLGTDEGRGGDDGGNLSVRNRQAGEVNVPSRRGSDENGRPPSHDGRAPRDKQSSTSVSPQDDRAIGPLPPLPPREHSRSFSGSPVLFLGSSPHSTDSHVSTPRQRSASTSAESATRGKRDIPGPILTRGKNFFGPGLGGTSHMFASSPQGARAARRARSFSEHRPAPSVWAQPDTPDRSGDDVAARNASPGIAEDSKTGPEGREGSKESASAGDVASSEASSHARDAAADAGSRVAGNPPSPAPFPSPAPSPAASTPGATERAEGFRTGKAVSFVGESHSRVSFVPRMPHTLALGQGGSVVVGGAMQTSMDHVTAPDGSSAVSHAESQAESAIAPNLVAARGHLRSPSPRDGSSRAGAYARSKSTAVDGRTEHLWPAGRSNSTVATEVKATIPKLPKQIVMGRSGDMPTNQHHRSSSSTNTSSVRNGGVNLDSLRVDLRPPAKRDSDESDGRGTPDSFISINSVLSTDSFSARSLGGDSEFSASEYSDGSSCTKSLIMRERRAALKAASLRAFEPPAPPPPLGVQAKSYVGGVVRPVATRQQGQGVMRAGPESRSAGGAAAPATVGASIRRLREQHLSRAASSARLHLEKRRRAANGGGNNGDRQSEQEQKQENSAPLGRGQETTPSKAVPRMLMVRFPTSVASSSPSSPPAGPAVISASDAASDADTDADTAADSDPAESREASELDANRAHFGGERDRTGSDPVDGGIADRRDSGASVEITAPFTPISVVSGMGRERAIARGGVNVAVARQDADGVKENGGAVGSSGGSTVAASPGPRLIPALEDGASPPTVAAREGLRASGGSGKGHNAPSPRAMDDLPPAEMGALGVSLTCALCGAAETQMEYAKDNDGVSGGKGEHGKKDAVEAAAAAAATAATATRAVEVQRCSRCRRGCCENCFKGLPVFCRGPKVVVPVCRDCFRCVDFENRWHHHLLVASREPDPKPSRRGEWREERPFAAGHNRRRMSASPASSPIFEGLQQEGHRLGQRELSLSDDRFAKGVRGEERSNSAREGLSVGSLGGGGAEGGAVRGAAPSFIRASARMFRRSLSNGAVTAPFASTAGSRRSFAAIPSPLSEEEPEAFPGSSSPVSRGVFATASGPISVDEVGRPESSPQESERDAVKALRDKAHTHRQKNASESSSSGSWLGSSIGSAWTSLGTSGDSRGAPAGPANDSVRDVSGNVKGAGRVTDGESGRGTRSSSDMSDMTGSSQPPKELGFTPTNLYLASPVSSSTLAEVEARAIGSNTPWVVSSSSGAGAGAGNGKSSGNGSGGPSGNTPLPGNEGIGATGGGSGGGGVGNGSGGSGRMSSPMRMSPMTLRGREPSECPCGAAMLYQEVMGGMGAVTAVRSSAGIAAGVGELAAAEDEARVAAHELLRSKAFAHLLTRGRKAVAYADLQSKAFDFLREQAAAAKAEESKSALKDKPSAGLLIKQDSPPAPPSQSGTPPPPLGRMSSGARAVAATAHKVSSSSTERAEKNVASAVASGEQKQKYAPAVPPSALRTSGRQQSSAGDGIVGSRLGGVGGGSGRGDIRAGVPSVTFSSRVDLFPADVIVGPTSADVGGQGRRQSTTDRDLSVPLAGAADGPGVAATRSDRGIGGKAQTPKDSGGIGIDAGAAVLTSASIGSSGSTTSSSATGPLLVSSFGSGPGAFGRSTTAVADKEADKEAGRRGRRSSKSENSSELGISWEMTQLAASSLRSATRAAAEGTAMTKITPSVKTSMLTPATISAIAAADAASKAAACMPISIDGVSPPAGVPATSVVSGVPEGEGVTARGRAVEEQGDGRTELERTEIMINNLRGARESSSRSLGAFDNEREKPRPNLDSGVETSEESDNLSSGGVGKTHQDQQTQRQHRRQHRKQQEQQQQRQQLSEQRQQEQRLQEVQQQELRQQEIRQQELRQQQQLQEEVREEVREDTLNTMEDDEEEEEEARRKRLASPPAHSRFLALGVPAARGGMGGREGVGMGFPVYRDEAFRDDEEEMQQRVKEREALFEMMMNGPGIYATKYPRRGKPRIVMLTLSCPSRGNGNGNASSSSSNSNNGSTRGTGVNSSTGSRSSLNGTGSSSLGRISPTGLFPGRQGSIRDTNSQTSSTVAHAGSRAAEGDEAATGRGSTPSEQARSLDSLVNLELVWNRQRGGKGSLRVREVVDTFEGPLSQVLQPVCEEMRRKAAKRGGVRPGGGTGGEEETFASLLTQHRTLDLKFATAEIRNRFTSAFKTFALEMASSTSGKGRIS